MGINRILALFIFLLVSVCTLTDFVFLARGLEIKFLSQIKIHSLLGPQREGFGDFRYTLPPLPELNIHWELSYLPTMGGDVSILLGTAVPSSDTSVHILRVSVLGLLLLLHKAKLELLEAGMWQARRYCTARRESILTIRIRDLMPVGLEFGLSDLLYHLRVIWFQPKQVR